jgi:bifunctional DNA-binding transcriptional regulator/antitoxin component of YhaV-PrlF toxin-antitoxin module
MRPRDEFAGDGSSTPANAPEEAPPMRFHATLQLHGKTATGFVVPDEVVEALGAGQRPPVRVTIGGYTYRNTIARMGGQFLLGVSAEHRAGAGVAAGDELEVEVELDDQPRTVEVPADLAAALDADPDVRRRFDALSYTHRKEHVRAVEDAKTAATRERRIAACVAKVRG